MAIDAVGNVGINFIYRERERERERGSERVRNCWIHRLRVNRIVAVIANDVRLFLLSRS